MDRDRALDLLRSELPELKRRYAVRALRLTGSTAKGLATPQSDVDVIVDFDDVPSLFTLGRLKVHLEQILGAKVDLLMESGLRPRTRQRALADAINV